MVTSIPPPGAHGGDAPAIAGAFGVDPATLLDLSQTLNPFAPDVAALVAARLDAVRRYPSPGDATALLADRLGVDPDRVLLTNGGSEAIALVAADLGGTVASEPEFGLHPRGRGGPRWRSDPHSPSGVLASPTDVADVWDEAFYPLATGHWTAGRPGVVVGSLTKVFACPGLRLGYVLASSPAQVERWRARQPTWSVNSLAIAVLGDLLDRADLGAWQRGIATARAGLVAVLERHGLPTRAADAPWVLADAPGLRDALAVAGVVVRDCASFGMPGWTRIAVPDDRGLERLDRALAAVR